MEIAVIIPTRDRAEVLRKTLSLLLRQLDKGDEVIVIDNGKGNKTQNIVENIFKRCSVKTQYVKLLSNGPSLSRNIGISKSTNKVIAFLDDDCLISKGWVRQVRNFYSKKRNKNIILQGKIVHRFLTKSIFEDIIFLKNSINESKVFSSNEGFINYINAGNFVCSREVINKYHNFFDWINFPFICEEKELAERLNNDGFHIQFSKKISVLHLKEPISLLKRYKIAYLYGFYSGRIKQKFGNNQTTEDIFADEIKSLFTRSFTNELKFISKNLDQKYHTILLVIMYLIIRELIYQFGYFLGKNIFRLKK